MDAEELVSDQVFESLLQLDAAASTDVAHRVALATLAGACRAVCEMYQGQMDGIRIRQIILHHLQDASPLCQSIFAVHH